jgi:hypothetical protein
MAFLQPRNAHPRKLASPSRSSGRELAEIEPRGHAAAGAADEDAADGAVLREPPGHVGHLAEHRLVHGVDLGAAQRDLGDAPLREHLDELHGESIA